MSSHSTLSNKLRNTQATPQAAVSNRWAYLLMLRLHFYIGLFVGPFIFVAAFTGALYALTPQIEKFVYKDVLYTHHAGEAALLKEQIQSALAIAGASATLAAVRPAPEKGMTTRIMFADPSYGPSEHRAIFIDPVTTEALGDFMVYGTGGVLPVRTWIDYLHSSLHLGDFGRNYSELAASWLWFTAIGGLILWLINRRRDQSPRTITNSRHTLRKWHSTMGVLLLIGLLFFSITGLTWSQWAGENISTLRVNLNWQTPRLNTALGDIPIPAASEHAHHAPALASITSTIDTGLFDRVLHAARLAGIDAHLVEIKPAMTEGQAWTVTEIDRSWPTQIDAVAVDSSNLAIVDRLVFADFPMAAKLTRWGIDAHMGILFGLPNQLFVAGAALGLCAIVIWGYMMWWQRQRAQSRASRNSQLISHELKKVPLPALIGLLIVAGLLGWCMPVMGVSLLVFLLIDFARGFTSKSTKQVETGI